MSSGVSLLEGFEFAIVEMHAVLKLYAWSLLLVTYNL